MASTPSSADELIGALDILMSGYQPRLDHRDYESLGHSAYYSASFQSDPSWRKTYAQVAINYYTTATKMGGDRLEASIEKARKLLDKE